MEGINLLDAIPEPVYGVVATSWGSMNAARNALQVTGMFAQDLVEYYEEEYRWFSRVCDVLLGLEAEEVDRAF
ncbi:hypothetical protein [Nocardiopsis synnemataformans]|uniref:hypothetical protein n=1 Tax=Nocardiopsis synnemataformans TaxID=61305 RepID=UPI003EB7F818